MRYINTTPATLRSDFKDQYRMLIAASYASTHDLARAKSRLELLGDTDPIQALSAQVNECWHRVSYSVQYNRSPCWLMICSQKSPHIPPTATAESIISNEPPTSTPAISLSGTETPQATPIESPTIEVVSTIIPMTITPRPTHTATPTAGAPFVLLSNDKVCKPNLTDGLMQISVINSRGHQMPGRRDHHHLGRRRGAFLHRLQA